MQEFKICRGFLAGNFEQLCKMHTGHYCQYKDTGFGDMHSFNGISLICKILSNLILQTYSHGIFLVRYITATPKRTMFYSKIVKVVRFQRIKSINTNSNSFSYTTY